MEVSVIIPTVRGNLNKLKTSLDEQSFQDFEIIIIENVKPNGKARNEGIKKAKGKYLIFIDDDAYLGNGEVIKNLIDTLKSNEKVGVCGVGQLIPPDANWLQRRIAKEIPRITQPIVEEVTESNPSLISNKFSAATTTCCGIKKEVFDKVGLFNEKLIKGVDTEFFYRVRKYGYDIYIARRSFVYHYPPATFKELLKRFFLYGIGTADQMKLNPQRKLKPNLKTVFHTLIYFIIRCLFLPIHLFFEPTKLSITFQPLRAITSFVSSIGYIYGWYKEYR